MLKMLGIANLFMLAAFFLLLSRLFFIDIPEERIVSLAKIGVAMLVIILGLTGTIYYFIPFA